MAGPDMLGERLPGRTPSSRRPARIALISLSAVAAAAIVAFLAVPAAKSQPTGRHGPATPAAGASVPAATLVAFEQLSRATSNQCGLQPAQLQTMPATAMLRGSCCTRMDLTHYEQQLAGLRQFSAIPQIPRDPYDISVGLGRQLVSYQSIPLDSAQQQSYNKAVVLSAEHGPCCCQCWRWNAFAGQARYLITHQRFAAAEVATVWNLEDGCGGP